MKPTTWIAVALLLQAAPGHSQETLADQKLTAEIDKLHAETEKIRLEGLAALRASSGGSATVDTAEKSAEGLLMRKALYQGAVNKMLTAIAPQMPASDSSQPIVIFGSTPRNTSALVAFDQEVAALSRDYPEALDGWNTAGSSMNVVPAIGVVSAVAATTVALFKTDTTIAGASASIEDDELKEIMLRSLAAMGYRSSTSDLRLIDSGALTKELLGAPLTKGTPQGATTLSAAYDEAKLVYEQQYKPHLLAAQGKWENIPNRKLAILGAALGNLITRYEALRTALLSDNGGVPNAFLITEQRKIANGNRSTYPLLYLTHHDAALSTITKKNITTGWRSTPAWMTGVATIDYAVVGGSGEVRGSTACVMERISFDSILNTLKPGTTPSC